MRIHGRHVLVATLVTLATWSCSKPTKKSQCKKVVEKMLSTQGMEGVPSNESFCVERMSAKEVSCVLDAADDLALLACFAQSDREGMEILCQAPSQVSLSGDAAEDGKALTDYIASSLRNPEAIHLFSTIGDADPVIRNDILNEAAKAQGLESCPFAEYLLLQP